jgi:hypothetical protein
LPADVALPVCKDELLIVLLAVVIAFYLLRVTPELGLTYASTLPDGLSRPRAVALLDVASEFTAAVREIGTLTSTIEWWSADMV